MISKTPNFSIIIPNYNGAPFLTECLESLQSAIKKCPQSRFEIIIVDNASKDNSLEIINKFNLLKIKIIKNKTNLGFAPAVNLGINQSKYNFVVPCNNDLHLEDNWFDLVSKAIQQNQDQKVVTFFGTVLNKEGDKYESQGLQFFIRGKCKNISNGKKFHKSVLLKANKLNANRPVWGASAALVVYKKDIIQKIGLFDNDFFAYEEDVDLALRLTKIGYKTLYISKAICYHLGGGTSNKMGNFRARMDAKNWIYLIIKNYSPKEYWSNFPSIFEERCRNLSGLVKATIKTYKLKSICLLPKSIFQTYGEVLIKLPKMIKKRKNIQKLIKSINL